MNKPLHEFLIAPVLCCSHPPRAPTIQVTLDSKDAPVNPISPEQLESLENRRVGIEPIIGHLKKYWQRGRSRMKSDKTTEASGYCALLGFNIRQMMRYLTGQMVAITPG